MSGLEELREKIDRIDKSIQQLIEERMSVSEDIGRYKMAHSLPVTDQRREEELITKLRGRAASPRSADEIEEIYRTLMKLSRRRQEEL